MSLATNIQSAFTRVGTEFKSIRTLIGGSGTATIAALTTTDKASLVAAINEVNAKPSGGGALAALTDTTITTPATGHLIRYNAVTSKWENVLGTTYFDVAGAATSAQSASQPVDSDLTAIAALTTTAFGRSLLTLLDAAALTAGLSSATLTVSGIIELATQVEVDGGADAVRAVTPATLQGRLAAGFQPLDTDLTAIAALATTAFGRGLLALADATALTNQITTGTTAVAGKLLLATNGEAQTGTDTAKATTAAGTKAAIDQRIDNNAALGSSTVNAPSQAAAKAYADGLLDANNAWAYKGVIDASLNPNYPAASAGWTYRIGVAGKIGGASGPNVEVGDTITCLVDATVTGTHAAVGANWIILQTNIDGAVTGPASSVAGQLVSFSGTTGKIVQDSGLSADNDGTLTANSATRLATQQAVKTFAQPKDATLTALAGVTVAANQVILATGADAFTVLATGTTGRALLGDATSADARTELSVYSQAEIGDPATDFVATFNAALL